jgi:hypothetical protein
MRYVILLASALAILFLVSFIFIPQQHAASQALCIPSIEGDYSALTPQPRHLSRRQWGEANQVEKPLNTPTNQDEHNPAPPTQINTAPVAVDDSYAPPGRFMPIMVAAPGVLANDNDADGDRLTAQLVTGPSNGMVTLQPDGGFTYYWAPGAAAADTFTYRASDGSETSSTAVVHIQMFPNNPPIAVDDSYATPQGQTLTVWSPGVLSNDKDADGDRLFAHPLVFPQHGSLNFDIHGGFTYVPVSDFSGTDSFLYHTDDGTAARSNPATVTITVTPAPTPTPTPELRVHFTSPTFGVSESCAPATLNLSLTNAMPGEQVMSENVITVDYTITGGTASQKSDYTYAAGTLFQSAQSAATKPLTRTLTFVPGASSQSIQVLINDDGYAEGPETIEVTLSNPRGAVLGSPSTAILIINDNELVDAASNPIDEPKNFVCQQYHDFLHRQPDDEGLAFWTNQITQCGTNQSCLDEMRHNVAMAFFLSIEFQQTGYFVDRLYEACLNKRPSYEEFIHDLQQVGFGVEVGAPGWDLLLEKNKRDYAEEFVQRSDFILRYPDSMGPVAYVDEMFEYAGVEPLVSERQTAIEAFGAGDTAGRAAAMRAVMESASVFRRYYNQAFVLVEYFGFLRRDPTEAPDTDWTGYDFWFRKMEGLSLPAEDVTIPADAFARVKRAEMVRAFIVSSEYRLRFGKS